VLLLELLYDHRDVLKARKGEVADLCWGMEELSATEKATTEEISRLKVDFGREVVARRVERRSLCSLGGAGEERVRVAEEGL